MSGNLAGNLLLFGRVLRGLGLDAGTGRMLDLVAALDHVPIGAKADFYYAARVARRAAARTCRSSTAPSRRSGASP